MTPGGDGTAASGGEPVASDAHGSVPPSRATSPARRRVLLLAPLAVTAAAGVGFWAMLRGLRDGSYDPRGVPSALIGQRAPPSALTPVPGVDAPALADAGLRDAGRPVLVNFWASWCVPCVIEHPELMRLSREGVPVLGINYKDEPKAAAEFLARRGNPFAKLGADTTGRVAINWGVYGVPETYLLDRAGVIRWRWAGPVTPEVVTQDLAPLLRRHA